MKFYLAPMEGLTGYVFRNVYHKYFHNIDRYFTPFLANKKMSYREINDILPEHNNGMEVVPQILTNRAEDFIMKELWHYLGKSFTNPEKYLKKIKKAERLADYEAAIDALFCEQEFIKD